MIDISFVILPISCKLLYFSHFLYIFIKVATTCYLGFFYSELLSIVFVSIFLQDTLIVFIEPSLAQVHIHSCHQLETFPDSAGPPPVRACHLEEFPSAWPGIRLIAKTRGLEWKHIMNKNVAYQNRWHFPLNLWLPPGWTIQTKPRKQVRARSTKHGLVQINSKQQKVANNCQICQKF